MSNKTVAKLFEEAGDMAIAYLADIGSVSPKRIQADEIHAFVAAKQKNVAEMVVPTGDGGTVWAYLGMCADTKLIFAYHLGDRGLKDATIFAKRMASKLRRDADGKLAVRPTIATDGLAAYRDAFESAFGDEADYGMMVKRYSKLDQNGEPLPSSRYVGSDRIPVAGSPHPADIHTAHIERQNLNLRMGNRRYTRRSNGFSKTVLNHERHLALWIMYHNLCWIPRASRPRRDETGNRAKQWIPRLPAAIAAGVDDRLWEIEDMLAATDAYTAARKAEADNDNHDEGGLTDELYEACSDAGESLPTHWVYYSHIHRSTKVHVAHCCNCRDGKGKKDGATTAGTWTPFFSVEAAREAAEIQAPDRHSICNMCIGSYRTLGYRHAGSSRQSGRPI